MRTSGSSNGLGVGLSVGAFASRNWDAIWATETVAAWREDWVAESKIDNATTSLCRAIWSDIRRDARSLQAGMEELEESARRAGIYPGIVRDLRNSYRLVW